MIPSQFCTATILAWLFLRVRGDRAETSVNVTVRARGTFRGHAGYRRKCGRRRGIGLDLSTVRGRVAGPGYGTVLRSASGSSGGFRIAGEQFARGENRAIVVFREKHFGATLFAIHQADDGDDLAALALGGFDRFLRGAAGGADVVHDRDALPLRFFHSFDLLFAAVVFRCLADQETLHRTLLDRANYNRRGHDRIGAHAQAADGVRLHGHFVEQLENAVAGEPRAFRVKRRQPAVEVVVALLPGGEGEVAALDGFRAQQIGELSFVINGMDIELTVEIIHAYLAARVYSKLFRQPVGNGHLQTLPIDF